MIKIKFIKLAFFFLLSFYSIKLNAQYNVNLISVSNTKDKGDAIKFGITTDFKISCSIDFPHTLQEGLVYLKGYYLVINGVPYPDIKIQNMALLSTAIKEKDNLKSVFEITYQTQMPSATEEVNGKTTLSKFWKQHYKPLYNQLQLPISLLSTRIDDQPVSSIEMKLRFYEQWRVYLFTTLFGLIFFLVIWFASRDNFTLFRDEKSKCSDPAKHPYSLSRVQVFIWTFTIFGFFAYIWAVTDFLPQITAAHLVLLGIAAGQRIIAQMIDAGKPPLKNAFKKSKAAADGCSIGFFRDIISDESGLSITRLQYLISTFIFIVVFITTAIQKLEMVDFSVEQLALMGTSAGLYLWNKKLDQSS